MSLDREYETSKGGPTVSFTVGTTQVRIRLSTVNQDGTIKRRSYAVRVSANCRARQGDANVTVSSSATATDLGMLIPSTLRWRYDVDSWKDAFLAIVANAAQTTVEITRVSDVDTDDTPVTV